MSTDIKPPREKQITSNEHHSGESLEPVHDVLCYLREFARQKPEIAALTCLGVGFILGWKLKPW
jgi:hypothetical protein